jgi:hypothetical protein
MHEIFGSSRSSWETWPLSAVSGSGIRVRLRKIDGDGGEGSMRPSAKNSSRVAAMMINIYRNDVVWDMAKLKSTGIRPGRITRGESYTRKSEYKCERMN